MSPVVSHDHGGDLDLSLHRDTDSRQSVMFRAQWKTRMRHYLYTWFPDPRVCPQESHSRVWARRLTRRLVSGPFKFLLFCFVLRVPGRDVNLLHLFWERVIPGIHV